MKSVYFIVYFQKSDELPKKPRSQYLNNFRNNFADHKIVSEVFEEKNLRTLDIIDNNLDIDWNIHYVMVNPNLTWDIIRSNSKKSWEWRSVASNKMNLGKKNG